MTGIGFGVAILLVGLFFLDSMDEIMRVEFDLGARQDVTLSFVEPTSAQAIHEVTSLPGVLSVEPVRRVAVRLRAGHRGRLVEGRRTELD